MEKGFRNQEITISTSFSVFLPSGLNTTHIKEE